MTLGIGDLDNAKVDVDHIAAIATSLAPTAIDRLGRTKDTLTGILGSLTQRNNDTIAQLQAANASIINDLAFITERGDWAPNTAYDVKDIVRSGLNYYVAVVPHVSGATFAADQATKWRIYSNAELLSGAGGAAMVGYKGAAAGSYLRTAAAFMGDRINVKNFGAIGDGGSHPLSTRYATLAAAQADYPFVTVLTDEIDWAAAQAAVNSITVGQAFTRTVFFPTGAYMLNRTIDCLSRNVALVGEGPRSSMLLMRSGATVVALDGLNVPAACIGLMNIGIVESGTQKSMVGVTVRNTGDFFIQNVYITTAGKALDIGSAATDVIFSMINQLRVECYGGQEAIRMRSGGGCWSNIYARKMRTQGQVGPCLWITGQSTSLQISNCAFGGKGATKSWGITSITGTATFFDVLAVGNTLLVGEQFVIRGTGTAFDGVWKADARQDANTLRVLKNIATTTINYNPATTAFLEKLSAIVCLDNQFGPVNESLWTNVLFEGIDDGGSAGGQGSVSLLLDATNGNGSIAGHQFTGCTYDGGQQGVALHGKNIGGGDYCISDIRFHGMIVRYARYGIYMREVRGIHISDFGGDCLRSRVTATEQAEIAALFLDGAGAQPIIGLVVSDSTFGRQPSLHLGGISLWSATYGLRITGAPTDLKFNNNHFFGLTAAVFLDGIANLDPLTRLDDTGCTYTTGVGGETGATRVQGMNSAATITLPFGDLFGIAGGTGVTAILGGWVGRKVLMYTGAAITFTASATIANTFTSPAGGVVTAFCDASGKWRLG